jgi:DNA-binding transcriptional ArsR family regulator
MRRDVFQAIADPTRREILHHIALEGKTPNVLAQHFDSTRQAVSKPLKILTDCGVSNRNSTEEKSIILSIQRNLKK